jgi:hypothetical protein
MCALIVHDFQDQNTLSDRDGALRRSGPVPGQTSAQKGLTMKNAIVPGHRPAYPVRSI